MTDKIADIAAGAAKGWLAESFMRSTRSLEYVPLCIRSRSTAYLKGNTHG